jgi:hypothetical protein
MTKSAFITTAKPLAVVIDGNTITAGPKKFSTGSVGFFLNGKIEVSLADGTIVKLQVSASLTAIGSKDWTE